MLTDEQLQDQCSLIKRMLEESNYFDGCVVEYNNPTDACTEFVIADCYWIVAYWNNHGLHKYNVGYYKDYDDGCRETVLLSHFKDSLFQCCVRIVKDMYESRLQAAMEIWMEEKACNAA